MYSSCFSFNDTADTESSTYGHTLSLHDALPISSSDDGVGRGLVVGDVVGNIRRNHVDMRAYDDTGIGALRVSRPGQDIKPVLIWGISFRSEEHTSELQSLMRISYAVFCLKKKIYHSVLPT